MEKDPRKQVVERLKEATNVLITVSNNPSVDQLAAAIGFTLYLNHLGKHATAVFSGEVPSVIEFLQPEKTLEKTTDSLRDFIIALDKAKADKLRYKVEDRYVKIFITPYRSSISKNDLEFSQGDFNVEVVLALGVNVRQELDGAITAHGRILHDATVISVTAQEKASSLGTINWNNTAASSLSEMMVDLTNNLKRDSLDEQMATAFLTGIVAATERFGNNKTTSKAMAASGILMAAGANSQLVAAKLEEPVTPPVPKVPTSGHGVSTSAQGISPPEQDNAKQASLPADIPDGINAKEGGSVTQGTSTTPTPEAETPPQQPAPRSDGALHIEHNQSADKTDTPASPGINAIHIDDEGMMVPAGEHVIGVENNSAAPGNGNSQATSTSVFSAGTAPNTDATRYDAGVPAIQQAPQQQDTLARIEEIVHSPHLGEDAAQRARNNVEQAIGQQSADTTQPIQALGASAPMSVHNDDENAGPDRKDEESAVTRQVPTDQNGSETPPPPGPPPIMPPPFNPPQAQ